jgi:hypothetical protein
MKKGLYIVTAIIIAAGLTAVQAFIADSIIKRNEMEVCIAVNDVKKGSIVFDSDIETIKIYKGEAENMIGTAIPDDIAGGTAAHEITAGSILYPTDVVTEAGTDIESGFVALEVGGANFNAGNLDSGDFVDLFMLPDFADISESDIVWLNGIFAKCGVRFIPGKQPGMLFENLLIAHIDTATGQSAKYVSIRVPRPLDEAIAFLEQISVYEFIGR